jgi:dienelactone hydrolase
MGRGGLLIGIGITTVWLMAGARAQDPASAGGTRLVDLDVWSRVVPEVAALAPLVAYDRAGLGQSDWDDQTPTPQHAVTRLRAVLDAIAVKLPYVLVGYSWGAVLAYYFAGHHPADVAGLVFVDPGPIVTESLAEQLAPFEAVGAGRRGYDAYWPALGALTKNRPPSARAEFEVLRQLMDAEEWALDSPHGTLVVSNATTHLVPREDPDLIVWATRRVLDQITR